jgi:type III secretion protein SpaR/YscT/HrcT
MSLFDGVQSLSDLALLAGLSSTRIAVAFLILPVFSQDTVPALIRNAIFLSMGLLAMVLQPPVSPLHWTTAQWMGLFVKEAFIGLSMGFGLAAFLWAFSAAGQVVDTKVAVANAQLTDPLSGQQVSISGAFLGRLMGYLFMVGGGFTYLVGALIESFRLWPIGALSIEPSRIGVVWFEQQWSDLMSLTFLIAAPALVIMFAVDLVLGLVNRFAQQLNVQSISASVKGLASTAIWLLMLTTLVDGFTHEWMSRINGMLPALKTLVPVH